MSFLKYEEDAKLREGNGRGNVSWNRAHVDGVPWRGPSYPLREEEYTDFTEEVQDFDVGVFDIRNVEEYAAFREIMDRAANGWYRILDYDKKWVKNQAGNHTILVYVMWTVPFRELAKRRTQAELIPTMVPQQQARLPLSG
jgi:hypothetical protein